MRLFVIRADSGKESISSLCAEFGISRETGYVWLRRYREVGSVNALAEHSRRPRTSPQRTDDRVERRVAQMRAQYGWGAEKISVLLSREGVTVPVRTVGHILKRLGLVAPEDVPRPAIKRFERKHPNELWQMDFKGEYRSPNGTCYPLTLLDDHSRYNAALYALPNIKADTVMPCFMEVFERHGLPEAILCDHGAPWYGTHSEHGLTTFAMWLQTHDIRIYHGRVRHPQTQGKIERLHGTIARHIPHKGQPEHFHQWQDRLDAFRYEYNHVRPHKALDLEVPANQFQKSERPYRPAPPEYPYPGDAPLERGNSADNINYNARQTFISKALIAQTVQLNTLQDKLVVRFWHMYVREIDLITGNGKPVLQEPEPQK